MTEQEVLRCFAVSFTNDFSHSLPTGGQVRLITGITEIFDSFFLQKKFYEALSKHHIRIFIKIEFA